MTTPASRPAGSIQTGEIVNGKTVVGIQNDSNVTVFYDDGSQEDFPLDALVPYS